MHTCVVHEFLSALRRHAAPGQITEVIEVPARPERTAEWPGWMAPALLGALHSRGVDRLWTHQVEAADLVHAGIHTVVSTGTGSGKSLAAWIPALSIIAQGGASRPYRPTALYLAPTKALAADQFASISGLARDVDPRIGVAVADGDSDREARAWAREHASIVLSNPDFAHHVMLANHRRWTHVWRGLSIVIVDEFHAYRGMFGAHVASTVRRLLRVTAHYGARPTVVFLSATSGDPEGAARRFLGTAFGGIRAVEEDGSPSGRMDIVMWRCREKGRPASREPRLDAGATADADATAPTPGSARRAAVAEAGQLMGVLASEGAQTVAFVRSRAGSERVAEIARNWLAGHRPGLEDAVASYRGGYLPEERRALEDALRTGAVRALASTNALELGIDIAGLDAIVVTGWPGTHASFAQQIGRTDRVGRDGLAVFVGRDDPLDQYLLSHPETVVSSPIEVNAFDPGNPHVLLPHLCAAACELPLTEADVSVFGLADTSLFDDLAAAGMLRRRPGGWFWNTSLGAGAHEAVDLRGEGSTVTIIDGESGVVLGTVDAARADATVFPGAVYLHQGFPYRVESLADDVAVVRPDRDGLRTFARQETSVEILSTEDEADLGIGTWAQGGVLVSSRVVGYDIRRADDGVYLGYKPLAMPVRRLHTHGTWWTMTGEAIAASGVDPAAVPGALHAAEHTAIGMLPLLATCDRWDIGGLSSAAHPETGQATVIVHDAVPGGSGCARRGFERGSEWVLSTLDALLYCPCDSGCPRCIQSPKCGNNNEPLSKDGATRLISTLSRAMAPSRSSR